MGLDMYLYAETYVSPYNYEMKDGEMTRVETPEYEAVNSIPQLNVLPMGQGGMTISKCVGYWRKANAVHGWIVRNLANDVDKCQRISMTEDDLKTLRDVCVNELSNRNQALPNKDDSSIKLDDSADIGALIANAIKQQANLPKTEVLDPLSIEPTAGFFFGSSEKDEYYYSSLEDTVDIINSLLAVGGDYDYYYQASW